MTVSAFAAQRSNDFSPNNRLSANKNSLMKHHPTNSAAAPQTPVFPETIHELRPNKEKVLPHPESKKRDNIFSKSRDLREDRGTREMKTSHNDQTNHAK
jgi:hypothetical protein